MATTNDMVILTRPTREVSQAESTIVKIGLAFTALILPVLLLGDLIGYAIAPLAMRAWHLAREFWWLGLFFGLILTIALVLEALSWRALRREAARDPF